MEKCHHLSTVFLQPLPRIPYFRPGAIFGSSPHLRLLGAFLPIHTSGEAETPGMEADDKPLDAGVAQRHSLRIHSISRLGPRPAGLALVLASSHHAARLRVTVSSSPIVQVSGYVSWCASTLAAHSTPRHSHRKVVQPWAFLACSPPGRSKQHVHGTGDCVSRAVDSVVGPAGWRRALGFEGSDP